jgi:hypothetical protein
MIGIETATAPARSPRVDKRALGVPRLASIATLLFGAAQKALFRKSFSGTRLEISLKSTRGRLICYRHIRAQDHRQMQACGNHIPLLMRLYPTTKVVR